MAAQDEFEIAAATAKTFENLSNDQLATLYKYYKQATVGDVNIDRPGMFSMDFTGTAKWDAWNSVKGVSKEDARSEYIKFVKSLEAK